MQGFRCTAGCAPSQAGGLGGRAFIAVQMRTAAPERETGVSALAEYTGAARAYFAYQAAPGARIFCRYYDAEMMPFFAVKIILFHHRGTEDTEVA
jgi:hypothetical protein